MKFSIRTSIIKKPPTFYREMPKVTKKPMTKSDRQREFMKRETAILKSKYSFLTPCQIHGKAQELWRKENKVKKKNPKVNNKFQATNRIENHPPQLLSPLKIFSSASSSLKENSIEYSPSSVCTTSMKSISPKSFTRSPLSNISIVNRSDPISEPISTDYQDSGPHYIDSDDERESKLHDFNANRSIQPPRTISTDEWKAAIGGNSLPTLQNISKICPSSSPSGESYLLHKYLNGSSNKTPIPVGGGSLFSNKSLTSSDYKSDTSTPIGPKKCENDELLFSEIRPSPSNNTYKRNNLKGSFITSPTIFESHDKSSSLSSQNSHIQITAIKKPVLEQKLSFFGCDEILITKKKNSKLTLKEKMQNNYKESIKHKNTMVLPASSVISSTSSLAKNIDSSSSSKNTEVSASSKATELSPSSKNSELSASSKNSELPTKTVNHLLRKYKPTKKSNKIISKKATSKPSKSVSSITKPSSSKKIPKKTINNENIPACKTRRCLRAKRNDEKVGSDEKLKKQMSISDMFSDAESPKQIRVNNTRRKLRNYLENDDIFG